MLLHDYIAILKRGWLAVLALTILGAIVGFGLSKASTPSYVARATVFVSTIADGNLADLQQGNALTTQRASSYANLAATSSVLGPVSQDVGVPLDDLRSMVTTAAREATSLVDITVASSKPTTSADVANAVATSLAREVSELDTRGADRSPVRVDLVDPAETPTVALTPKTTINTALGGLIGLVLGLGSVIVANALDSRIRTVADLPEVPGLRSVTAIPPRDARDRRNQRLESLRSLRANVQFGRNLDGAVAVAPVSGDCDALSLSREFAGTLAEVGLGVVVVNADLRTKSGSRRSSSQPTTSGRIGLSEALAEDATTEEVVFATSNPLVHEIYAGRPHDASAQLLSTSRAHTLINELRSAFDVVLVVCPPITERSEAAVVAALTDDCVVVVESRATNRAALLSALDVLAGVRVSSVSVVVDNVRDSLAAGALWQRPTFETPG